MSLNSLITEGEGYIADAYTAVEELGGTLPTEKNLANLPDAIGTITCRVVAACNFIGE